jgi:FlaA1/EpsC-like NDP-sugar epimerase
MSYIINKFTVFFINSSKLRKRIIMLLVDISLINFSFFISFFLYTKNFFYPDNFSAYIIFFFINFLAILIFIRMGLYRSIIRFIEFEAIWQIFKAVLFYIFSLGLVIFLFNFQEIPRSVILINFILLLNFICASRLIAKHYLFLNGIQQNQNQKNILVYGAGRQGTQLINPILYNTNLNLCGFLDDSKSKQGQFIKSYKVYPLENLAKLIVNLKVDEIIISINLNKSKYAFLFEIIKNTHIKILQIPHLSKMIDDNFENINFKNVDIEDLLGRDKILPIKKLIDKNIVDKSIIITGAGGTIGSEISRIALSRIPKILILYEQNEFSLYKIYNELKLKKNLKNTKIIPILGNILDYEIFDRVLKKFQVQTMFHAAAYKHVDIVEQNLFNSLNVNIFGSYNCIKLSVENKLENFVFISSDKAVRPTNFMGASKRISELLVKYFYKINDKENKLNFSIVRFGNVIGSSGSVIPLFKKQIEAGGPITVTHQNMTRYFMTVTEAAELVIQASALSSNYGIFLLNMGNPVSIKELALKMIRLSGLKYKANPQNSNEIGIIYTGLREGEKMFEELLVDKNSKKTEHQMIFKSIENEIDYNKFISDINELKNYLNNYDYINITKILAYYVEDFDPPKVPNDLILN